MAEVTTTIQEVRTKIFVGHALYLELRRGTDVSQVILTPQLYNESKDTNTKPYIISRNLRPETQRKAWRYTSGPRLSFIGASSDVASGVAQVSKQLNWVAPLLVGYNSGGWKIFKTPLVVELSNDDMRDILAKKSPSALLRRIKRARAEAGFPEEVAVSLPYISE